MVGSLFSTATHFLQLTYQSFCAMASFALASLLILRNRLLLIGTVSVTSITFVMVHITCESTFSPNVLVTC